MQRGGSRRIFGWLAKSRAFPFNLLHRRTREYLLLWMCTAGRSRYGSGMHGVVLTNRPKVSLSTVCAPALARDGKGATGIRSQTGGRAAENEHSIFGEGKCCTKSAESIDSVPKCAEARWMAWREVEMETMMIGRKWTIHTDPPVSGLFKQKNTSTRSFYSISFRLKQSRQDDHYQAEPPHRTCIPQTDPYVRRA